MGCDPKFPIFTENNTDLRIRAYVPKTNARAGDNVGQASALDCDCLLVRKRPNVVPTPGRQLDQLVSDVSASPSFTSVTPSVSRAWVPEIAVWSASSPNSLATFRPVP